MPYVLLCFGTYPGGKPVYCDPITFSGLDLLCFSGSPCQSPSLRRTEASATPWPLAFVLVEIFLLLEIRLTTACGTSRVESQWYAVLGVAAKEIGKVGVAHGHGDDHAAT